MIVNCLWTNFRSIYLCLSSIFCLLLSALSCLLEALDGQRLKPALFWPVFFFVQLVCLEIDCCDVSLFVFDHLQILITKLQSLASGVCVHPFTFTFVFCCWLFSVHLLYFFIKFCQHLFSSDSIHCCALFGSFVIAVGRFHYPFRFYPFPQLSHTVRSVIVESAIMCVGFTCLICFNCLSIFSCRNCFQCRHLQTLVKLSIFGGCLTISWSRVFHCYDQLSSFAIIRLTAAAVLACCLQS